MKKVSVLLLSFIIIFSVFAQKKPLSYDNYAGWKSIASRQISNNGEWVAYELNEQKGNGVLLVYSTKKASTDTIHYGYKARFSPNSDFLVYQIKPDYDTVRQAKLDKVKKDNMPKDSLGIYILETGERHIFPKAKSYKLAKEESSWLALYINHEKAPQDTTIIDSTKTDTVPAPKVELPKKNKKAGKLIITNPTSELSYSWDNVVEYTIAKKGGAVAFITNPDDSTKMKTIHWFNTQSQTLDTIFRDSCHLKKLTIDAGANYLTFMMSRDTVSPEDYSLELYPIEKKETKLSINTDYPGITPGYTPSQNGKIYFSEDKTKLYFGIAELADKSKNDSILNEEIPKVDVWSWTDIQIQPMQLRNLKKEQKRTNLCVLHLKNKKLIVIEDSIYKKALLANKNNGQFALIVNSDHYLRASSWTGDWWCDFARINLNTGEKTEIIKEKSGVRLHPTGKYAIWFDYADSNYYVKEFKKGTIKNLSHTVPLVFCNELNDMPTKAQPYGMAGWGADGQSVVVYDRYDLWKFDLTGKKQAINLTNGYGRENKIRLRYQKLDNELVYLPEDKVFLKGFQEETMKDGYFLMEGLRAQNPKILIQGDYSLGRIAKAKNSNNILWNKSTIDQYPEIQLGTLDFAENKVISKANPQQEDYIWANVEIVEWTSFAGEKLKGLLYKPENFDPNKKYPTVVYFYERNAETIHRHYYPYPSYSTINKTFYCSNGYLVFVPDITYKTGYPGQSAYNAIVSGTQALIERFPFIDKDKIALQGQSWGGYQTAYLVTQTDMFAAGMAGAPVSNMTSAYGGIRWGTGMSRMFQYEHTQSRIGGTLWEKPMQYIENSPLFYVPKVNTPLLIMHNDQDGAVPWYQGIEYFMALRRCNKPAWLLNYNGMPHNLSHGAWANRVDLSKRMMQFFDHYLKDKPAPEWMTKGIPAIDKGKNLGY
jgi:dipeptidyl aminopeptidase/acylaminoacyl peptidase